MSLTTTASHPPAGSAAPPVTTARTARPAAPATAPRQARTGNPMGRWFADRNVGSKILIAVLTAAFVALTVGVVAIMNLRTLAASADEMYERGVVPLVVVGEAIDAQNLSRITLLNLLVDDTEAQLAQRKGQFEAADAAWEKALEEYVRHPQGGGRAEQVAVLREVWPKYQQVRDEQMLPLARDSKLAELSKVRDEVQAPLTVQLEKALYALMDLEDQSSKVLRDQAADAASSATKVTIAVLLGDRKSVV